MPLHCFYLFTVPSEYSDWPDLLSMIRVLTLPFANSLDPDQDRHNVSSDLDPNSLIL